MSKENSEKVGNIYKEDKDKTPQITEDNEKGRRNRLSFIYDIYEEFRNLGISNQFLFLYFLFLGIFVFVLVYSKIRQIDEIMYKQTNTYFYNVTIKNLLEVQQSINVDWQQRNSALYQKLLGTNMFFFKIYSKELINNNFLLVSNVNDNRIDISINFNNAANLSLFNSLSDQYYEYNLLADLSTIANYKNISSVPKDESVIGVGLLAVPMYLFSPVFSQRSRFGGLLLNNFNLVAYQLDSNNNCVTGDNNNVFFKYPYEKKEIKSLQTNYQIFDIILDPVGKCFLPKTSANKTLTKKYNWFYQLENHLINTNKTSEYDVVSLLRLSDNYLTDEYVSIILTNKMTINNKNYIISYSLKMMRYSISSSIKQNYYNNDINSALNYMIFWNLYNHSNYRINYDYSDGIYFNKYNIDDNSVIIFNYANQLNTIFRYGLEPNNLTQNNINSMLITKDLIDNYSGLQESFFYSMDNLFFQFASFANSYYHSQNLYKVSNGTIDTDRCSINNLTRYYERLQTAYNNSLTYFQTGEKYDCLQDACHYVNCYNDSELTKYQTTWDSKNIYPNCLCMPMYCYNKNSIVPPEFQVFMGKNKTLEKNCQIYFERMKSSNDINYSTKYIVFIRNDPLHYRIGSSTISLFLVEKTQGIGILQQHTEETDILKMAVYIFYSVTLFIISLLFFKITSMKFSVFNERIDDSINVMDELIMVNDEKFTTEKEESEKKEEEKNLIESAKNDDDKKADHNEDNKIDIAKKEKKSDKKSEGKDKEEENNEENCEDELDEIKTLIRNNRNEFKIDFDSNRNMFMEDKTILQFIVEVKKQKYLLNFTTEVNRKNLIKENESSFIENLFDTRIETTVQIISELLSTELISFERINQNFYYVDKGKPPKNKQKFTELIEKYLYDEQVRVNEIMVDKVIESLINYYYDEINEKWVNRIVNI